MTILSTLQHVARLINLRPPSSVIGSTDPMILTMLEIANEEGKYLRTEYDWAQLSKEYTFTLSASTETYALPYDFDRFLHRTMWDRSQNWEIRGPLTPQEWQWRKSGVSSQGPRENFRIRGSASNQFYINPTPGSTDSGRTIVFEYQSASWIRPKTWTANTVFGASTYCFYNGNYYQTNAGGTTGVTPPTHTTGSASDGGVTWNYDNLRVFDSFIADTDVGLLPERIIGLGIQYRMLRQRGLEYQHIQQEYQESLMKEGAKIKSAPNLSLSRTPYSIYLGPLSIPDSGFGS